MRRQSWWEWTAFKVICINCIVSIQTRKRCRRMMTSVMSYTTRCRHKRMGTDWTAHKLTPMATKIMLLSVECRQIILYSICILPIHNQFFCMHLNLNMCLAVQTINKKSQHCYLSPHAGTRERHVNLWGAGGNDTWPPMLIKARSDVPAYMHAGACSKTYLHAGDMRSGTYLHACTQASTPACFGRARRQVGATPTAPLT